MLEATSPLVGVVVPIPADVKQGTLRILSILGESRVMLSPQMKRMVAPESTWVALGKVRNAFHDIGQQKRLFECFEEPSDRVTNIIGEVLRVRTELQAATGRMASIQHWNEVNGFYSASPPEIVADDTIIKALAIDINAAPNMRGANGLHLVTAILGHLDELRLCLTGLETIVPNLRINHLIATTLLQLQLEHLVSTFREKAQRLVPILNLPFLAAFKPKLEVLLNTYIKRAKSLLHLHDTSDISGLDESSQALILLGLDIPALVSRYFRNDLFYVPNNGSSLKVSLITGVTLQVPIVDEREVTTYLSSTIMGPVLFDAASREGIIKPQLERMKSIKNYPLQPFYERLSLHPSNRCIVYTRNDTESQSLEAQLKYLQAFLMARSGCHDVYEIATRMEELIANDQISAEFNRPIFNKIRQLSLAAQGDRAKALLLAWLENHFLPSAQR